MSQKKDKRNEHTDTDKTRSKGAVEFRDDGFILKIYAQPGAKRTAIVGLHDGMLKIAIKEKALDGAANEALLAFLAEHFGISKSSVTLVRGKTSRQKSILIRARALETIMEHLDPHLKAEQSRENTP